jgi:hypothetical protein
MNFFPEDYDAGASDINIKNKGRMDYNTSSSACIGADLDSTKESAPF